jgi:hypothetical protein
VLPQEAPKALAVRDSQVPGEIGRGNYIKADLDEALLDLLRAAYVEARETESVTQNGISPRVD